MVLGRTETINEEARRRRRTLGITEQFPGEAPPRDLIVSQLAEPPTERPEWLKNYRYPIVLTSTEAQKLGFELETDWMLNVVPQPDEDILSFISPEGLEIPLADIEAPAEPELPYEIGEVPEPEFRYRRLFENLYPDLAGTVAITTMMQYAGEQPERFLLELREMGRTPEVEDLLRAFGLTEDELATVFPPKEEKPLIEGRPKPVETMFVEIDGIRQMVVRAEDNSLYDIKGDWIGWYMWADRTVYNPYLAEGLAGKALDAFVGGIGDVITTAAGASRWLGYEEAGEKLSTMGAHLQRYGQPTSSADFEASDLLNPEFYATKIVRAIPFALSLAPLGITGFYGGAATASAIGLGTIWQYVVGGLTGAALSRPLESAMEAGGQYDDAIARGKSEKEAREEANQVFTDNMKLAGMDAFQIAIALAPTPKWVPATLVKSGLVRTTRIAGKMVIVGLSEGGEEVYQDMIQRHARGEEWQLDPVSKEVFAIGMVMGWGMGLGGDVVASVVSRSKREMPSDMRDDFNNVVRGFQEQGFNKNESELRALDTISQTPEGEKFLSKIVNAVKKIHEEERGAIGEEAERIPEGVRPLLHIEDLEGMDVGAKTIATVKDNTGADVVIKQSEDSFYAVKNGQVVGFVSPLSDTEIDLNVVVEEQRKGIGTKLLAEFRKQYPEHPLGGLTVAGEKTVLAAQREVAPPVAKAKPITEDVWNISPVADRSSWAKLAGLEGKVGSKAWADLTASEQSAIRGARIEITPEVVPVAKELPAEVKPPPEITKVPEKVVEIEKPVQKAVTSELQTIISDLEVNIEASQATLKGKKGEEARIARQALTGLEREFKLAQSTLTTFQEQINVPDAAKLRSTIMAMAKFKGLGKTQLTEIFKEVAGKRQMRAIASPQLLEILEKVRTERPVRIAGQRVVTPKTEKKIQSLKDSLVSSRQMTNEIYEHLMERLNLRTDRYEHATKFISETDAKELIRAMNDEVVLAKWDIKVQDALAKNPAIKEIRDVLNDRGMTGTGIEIAGEKIKISRGNELWSMRYYMLNLQKKLSAPMYDAWQKINMGHLVARDRHNQQIRRIQETTPNFREVVSDEVALKRIEDYIASKHNLAKIKAPELSEDEMAIATELEKGYFEAENDVRFIRFTNAYAEKEGDIDLIAKEIPSAPRAALRRAIDIYEGKGADELRKFTDTQKWGVIGSGYDPRSFIKPVLYFHAPKETTFAKGLLRTREGVEYENDDTNIIQRYSRHQKQLIALQEMSNLIRAFGRLYSEHAVKLAPGTQRDVSKVLSRGLNEMKGYREDGGAIVHFVERLYGQVASAVFWRPDLVGRNKFQNFSFNTDYWAGRFLDQRNKPISNERRRWFEVFVSQERVFQYDFLLYGEKPLPGFGRLTRWARRTSLYPWSDKTNRAEAFYVRINRVDRALDAYEKDSNVQKLIDDSGLHELEERQQAEALELLAMNSVEYGIDDMDAVAGREAFALYNAQQNVANVHFKYDRAERAPAEMGATGKTLGNILVFNRSWGERFILQGRKLAPDSKASVKEKLKAVQVIVGVIVAGLIAGTAYKEVTGKEHNPYNPLNIITWSPGGLALGVTEDISNTIWLITQAVQGDKSALASLPGVIAGVATLTLPFYKNAVQAFDAITDMKNVDVWALRKIREMIDGEYEVRGGTHEVERTLLEKFQRAIFSLKDDPVTPQEKIEESESMLGMDIEVADLAFNLEEPDIHDMGKLNTDMSRILKNIKPEEITKENGYSEMAVAWLEKEGYEAIWNTMPHKKLYEITELPEELAKWANRNKRKLALITKYQKLEGAEARQFLKDHPELKENPSINYLKQFPIANAQLALWGQTKLYTMEAYDEFNRLVKELDIPDDAIPELTLPPKGSVENYFKYQDMLNDFAPNSWEVQLLMSQDDDLRQFLERQPIETPVRSLELKIKHRSLYEQYDALETDEDRAKLKADNPEWVDDMRRVEAIENGADEKQIEEFVEYGRVVDKYYASSAQAKIYRSEHPKLESWATNSELRGNDAWQGLYDDPSDLLERNEKTSVWRVATQWEEYEAKYEEFTEEERAEFWAEAKEQYIEYKKFGTDYLVKHDLVHYAFDRLARDAVRLGFTAEAHKLYPKEPIAFWNDLNTAYVDYYMLPDKGYRRERYLIDNPDFANAMHTLKGIDLPKAEEVPSVRYDELYERRQDDFDKLWGLSDNKSPYYIEDEVQRQAEREAMRYSKFGVITGFGRDEKRLEAYGLLVPEKHIESYVQYYSLSKPEDLKDKTGSDLWYEDDWWMMEHQDFYKEVYLGIRGNERKDYRTVPTREVFAKYLEYIGLDLGNDRLAFREDNLDLDAWLETKFGYTPISEREEIPEKPEEEPEDETEELLSELEEKIKRLTGVK